MVRWKRSCGLSSATRSCRLFRGSDQFLPRGILNVGSLFSDRRTPGRPVPATVNVHEVTQGENHKTLVMLRPTSQWAYGESATRQRGDPAARYRSCSSQSPGFVIQPLLDFIRADFRLNANDKSRCGRAFTAFWYGQAATSTSSMRDDRQLALNAARDIYRCTEGPDILAGCSGSGSPAMCSWAMGIHR